MRNSFGYPSSSYLPDHLRQRCDFLRYCTWGGNHTTEALLKDGKGWWENPYCFLEAIDKSFPRSKAGHTSRVFICPTKLLPLPGRFRLFYLSETWFWKHLNWFQYRCWCQLNSRSLWDLGEGFASSDKKGESTVNFQWHFSWILDAFVIWSSRQLQGITWIMIGAKDVRVAQRKLPSLETSNQMMDQNNPWKIGIIPMNRNCRERDQNVLRFSIEILNTIYLNKLLQITSQLQGRIYFYDSGKVNFKREHVYRTKCVVKNIYRRVLSLQIITAARKGLSQAILQVCWGLNDKSFTLSINWALNNCSYRFDCVQQ